MYVCKKCYDRTNFESCSSSTVSLCIVQYLEYALPTVWFIPIDIMVFRAIFDLSNKIGLLILLRMYALYVKKAKV